MAISKNLRNFKSTLTNLTVTPTVFRGHKTLYTFEANMPRLVDTTEMFSGCVELEKFKGEMGKYDVVASELKTPGMFSGCTNLKEFICEDLSNLGVADDMFNNCKNLPNFIREVETTTTPEGSSEPVTTKSIGSLQSLHSASNMFYGCTSLGEFKCNLPALKNGNGMFNGCTALEKFTGDLDVLG